MPETIVTLTMNPAVDLCARVERVVPFHKLRCATSGRDPGGGGINVARAIHRMGGDPLAVFPVGGPIGQLLERLVAEEGVRRATIEVANHTREDITIDENATGAQFRFVLAGMPLSAAESEACVVLLSAKAAGAKYVVASGSLPPGLADDFYAGIAKVAVAAGAKFILDTSGPALKAALGSDMHLIKPSLREFTELVGYALPDERAWLEAARRIIANRGAEMIALSLGERGAALIGADFALRASAPAVASVSTVGAGDSFLGALVRSFAQDMPAQDALRMAVAAGSAAMLSAGTDLCHPADVHRLAKDVEIRPL
ncbi:MAG TPA: 1-phosphofructokinase family hexose kinase [Rhizomicrobium sp.]|jgi:6-phosphofructokinase 2